MPEINGTDADDVLDGTGSADVITGFYGSDTLNGGDGNDVLYGGSGGPPDPIERLWAGSLRYNSGGAVVSPDGQTVLFWAQADYPSWVLNSLDRATGVVTRLTTNAWTSSTITFSPDGSLITYQVGISGSVNEAAWIMNLETGQRYAVSKNDDGDVSRVLTDPVFSTDGQSILGVTTRMEADWGDVGLYLVEWDLAGAIVSYVRLDVPPNNAEGVEIAFSADQQQLVLRYEAAGDQLTVLDRTTGAVISEIDAASGNSWLRGGVLSADGGMVAWVGTGGLHIYDVATETDRLLMAEADSMDIDSAQFALGGRVVVVQVTYQLRGQDNFEQRIVLVDVMTGDAIELAVAANPVVSADGTFIIFSSDATLVPGDTNRASDVFLLTLPEFGEPSDTLSGGAGNDTLDGGWGADVMTGGIGNDSYYVDNSGDVVTELAGGGIDTVYSSVSYTLAEGANVEVVQLIGRLAINATGGAGDDTLIGNDGANILEGGAGTDVLRGGKGADTYVIRDIGDQIIEVTGEGTDTVQSWISFSFNQKQSVENLTLMGTADLNATGNTKANVIRGNSGDNTLDGGTAADKLHGGAGDDTYIVDDGGDQVFELADEGFDTVRSKAGFALSDNVENLVLLGTALSGWGNDLVNVITGNASANILDGKAGADRLIGGKGNDTFYVDNLGDVIVEAEGDLEGVDLVYAAISFALKSGSYVENLTLTGSALDGTGNGIANVITGNSGANRLDGGKGDDTLDGGIGDDTLIGGDGNDILKGGQGVDDMSGGEGDDTYYVDDLRDWITEAKGSGTDLVLSSVGFTLQPGVYVENLTLTGSANINGTGNGLSNVITGNSGVNVLAGGKGNDTYVVQNTTDSIVEAKSEGTDLVNSSVTFTLASGVYVENLTLTGSSKIDGTGNGIDNVIRGNSGSNILNGGAGSDTLYGNAGNDTLNAGSSGADKMYGGVGNDTYVVNSSGDKAYELNGEGTDTVNSSANYSLTGQYIENLTLTGSSGVYAKGNTLDNTLIGNSGANKINGMQGKDTLTGGGGADTFIWDATSHSRGSGSDLITDLSNADFIDLSRIDANTTQSGTQHFVLVDAFSNTAGQVMLSYNAGTNVTSLNADTNGDGVSDMLVRMDGDHTDFTNFIFGGG